MAEEKIRVLIVEDHPIYRMGLKELINAQKDMAVCGEAEDVKEARRSIREVPPDMIILDLALKNSSGVDLIKELADGNRKIPVLVLSMHDESVHAQRCIAAGARGYIMKQEASVSVVNVIRHIVSGNCYVSERIMTQLLNRMCGQNEPIAKSPIDSLTDRELEIFQLIGRGHSPSKIALQLHLSVKTVGAHKERIKEKLSITDGGELVKFAILWSESGSGIR
ncbi:MAG: response regulator transcription factor [Pseudomonadota bacterium]